MAVTGGPGGAGEAGAHLDPPRLACGRDAAAVWDRAVAGAPDAHERDCPHCGAVALDQQRLAAAIEALDAERLEPPPSLLQKVMGAVLTELRPRDYLPLPAAGGPARIDRAAAAAVLRHAVDQMPGVWARSCRIELIEPGSVAVGGGPPVAVAVTLGVTARFGTDLPTTTARVRQMVLAAAQRVLGLPLDRVDVEVVDVFLADEPGPDRGGRP